MPVDDSLDFFGVDLEAADIDGPVSAADKVIAVSTQLNQIVRVDKAVVAGQGLGAAPEVTGGVSSRTDTK